MLSAATTEAAQADPTRSLSDGAARKFYSTIRYAPAPVRK